jgi:hypothetical protein
MQIDVPARDTGRIYLFALNLTPEEVAPLIEPPENPAFAPVTRPTAAASDTLLGVAGLDAQEMELFPVRDLEGVGLGDYLVDGHGMPETQVAPDRGRLAALDGHVLLVYSEAFRGAAATLSPSADLTHIGTYGRPPTDWNASPIDTASAEPFSGKGTSPREARDAARRTGATIFAVVMGILLLLVLWLVF